MIPVVDPRLVRMVRPLPVHLMATMKKMMIAMMMIAMMMMMIAKIRHAAMHG